MKILNCAGLYLDGVTLCVLLFILAALFITFVIVGLCYLESERKSDKLEYKNRKLRADLHAAELENNSLKLKLSIRKGDGLNV